MVDNTTTALHEEKVKLPPKTKTRYIVSHGYKGDLSMKNAFQEVIENRVLGNFERWKENNY